MAMLEMFATGQQEGFLAALLVTVVAVVLSGIFIYWTTSRRRKEANWVPYAPGYGMIETIQRFSGGENPFFLHEMSQKAGTVNFRIRLPLNLTKGGVYVIGDPELVRDILMDPLSDKSEQLGATFDRFHNGQTSMFTQTNAIPSTKIMRKGTMPAFSKNQVGRMNAVARGLVDDLMTNRLPNVYTNVNK